LAARVALLAGLLALTAWTATRSDALTEAEGAYRRKNLIAALRCAEDHLVRRPWSREAERLAARCLSELDFADAAELHYQRAGGLNRDDLHVRAYGLVRANQRKKAEEAYLEILKRWPEDALALRRLAAELMTQSRWDDALVYAERLARVPEGDVDGWAMTAVIHHEEKNPEAAIAAYEKVLELDPDLRNRAKGADYRREYWSRIFWLQFCEDLLRLGRASDVRQHLEKALAENEDPLLRRLLGTAYYVEGNFSEAERAFHRAVEAEPTFYEAWLDLGRVAQAQKRPADAVEPLLRAHRLSPETYEPVYRLSQVYRMLRRTEEADRFGKLADEIRRRSPPPTSGMGAMPTPSP
jgi:tetratricopeptide (TPR) repeat protein